MPVSPDFHRQSPNPLARLYTHFRVAERLLLTGHSHQAWPDVGLEGQVEAWRDAATLVDDKWDEAFARADRVRGGFARLMGDPDGEIALGSNTHELLVRFLSALPLLERPRIVTTAGEFHTARRQLDRLEEEGIEVVRVPVAPHEAIAGRLGQAVNDRTAAVIVSSVLFESGRIVSGLPQVAAACQRVGAQLLVDAYHHLNVVPFSVAALGLQGAFITGGGYKYCQLGEGNCFLRLPPGCALRPVVTGWFSEFATLETPTAAGPVLYGEGPWRFAGSTYDPTSHYRAAAVLDFFTAEGLTPEVLRTVSQHQVGLLAQAFDALDLDPALIARDRAVPLREVGGFLVLHSPRAQELCRLLRERGVLTDVRGEALRLGPAPYLAESQLIAAIEQLGEVLADLR